MARKDPKKAEPEEDISSKIVSRAAYSIDEFIQAYGLSRSLFWRLRRAGRAPRLMHVGRRVLISVESAQDWRRSMEETE